MATVQQSVGRILLVLMFISVAAGGCAAPTGSRCRQWEQLLANHEQSAARRWFLDVLRSNGVEEEFLAAMSRWPIGKRQWDVETVRAIPGTNGLVYVQIRPDPEYMPGREAELEDWWVGPERFWFFFDRSGNLLEWSDDNAGTWLVVDVTGDGVKDLLVSGNKGLGRPQQGDGRVYYTLFRTSTSPPKALPFGASAVEGISYGFTLIYLGDHFIPLVMTSEAEFPVEDEENLCDDWGALMPETTHTVEREKKERDEWYGTVIRSFKHGEPKVILAVPSHLTLCTSPGGEVVLQPEYEDAGYKVQYSLLNRRFEVEWAEKEPRRYLRMFSATVPR